MVHNGIEYSDMQLIGEAYQLLRDGLGKSAGEIADVFDEWNKGDLDSFLVEITARGARPGPTPRPASRSSTSSSTRPSRRAPAAGP
jgi:6-phosphogluconate dehydrogenase (decarboxylating)